MKRMMAGLAACLLLSGILAAEDAQRVFQLKHARAKDLAEMFRLFAKVSYDAGTNSIAVAGSETSIKAIEEAVARLDVPRAAPQQHRGVELIFHVVRAGTSGTQALAGKELESVSRQLAQIFGYTKLELLDTIPLRGMDGDYIRSEGLLRYSETNGDMRYLLMARAAPVEGPKSAAAAGKPEQPAAAVVDLNFTLKIPQRGAANDVIFADAKINTSVRLREGQKVVVGKTNSGSGTADGALFLVVSYRLTD